MNDIFSGVVIDPGHGGIDSGAIGSDILEKDYNLQISRYMYDRFRELGVPVYLTRDSDVTLNPSDRVRRVLSFFGNDPNVVVVSNHLNAGGRAVKLSIKSIIYPFHFYDIINIGGTYD